MSYNLKIARELVEGVWRTWRKLSKEQKRNEETLDNIFIERISEALDSASKLPKQEYIGQSPKVEESDRERARLLLKGYKNAEKLWPSSKQNDDQLIEHISREFAEIRAEAQSPVSVGDIAERFAESLKTARVQNHSEALNAMAYDYTTENGGDKYTRDAFKAGYRLGAGDTP